MLRQGRPARRGFTLVELLAVIALLVVVLGIAVPAFRGMLDASEKSLAENSLRVGVTVARDLATRGEGDAALVVIRDPDGRTRLVPVLRVGTMVDALESPFATGGFDPATDPSTERDVFAPIGLGSPILLPAGYSVAGAADPNTIDVELSAGVFEGWYDSEAYGDNGSTGQEAEEARVASNWLLPETWLYEPLMQAAGAQPPDGYTAVVTGPENVNRTPRQSFMIRFESGTGLLVRGARPAIVLDPRPTALGRGQFTGSMRWARADRVEDARQWASRVINTRDFNGDGETSGNFGVLDETMRVIAIGNFSNDTVLAGTVSRVALFREDQLAEGLGAGVNTVTKSLYRPLDADGRIAFDMDLFDANPTVFGGPEDVRVAINRWMQGDTNFIAAGGFDVSDGDGDGNVFGDFERGDVPADEPLARVFFVHPGTADLTEVNR